MVCHHCLNGISMQACIHTRGICYTTDAMDCITVRCVWWCVCVRASVVGCVCVCVCVGVCGGCVGVWGMWGCVCGCVYEDIQLFLQCRVHHVAHTNIHTHTHITHTHPTQNTVLASLFLLCTVPVYAFMYYAIFIVILFGVYNLFGIHNAAARETGSAYVWLVLCLCNACVLCVCAETPPHTHTHTHTLDTQVCTSGSRR